MSVPDLVYGVIEIDKHLPAYIEAEEMYNGTAKEYFANDDVGRKLESTGQIGRFNFIKRVINTVANRIKISQVNAVDNDAVQELLDAIREANEMDLYDNTIIKKTLMYGDSYVLIWKVPAESGVEDDDMMEAEVSLTFNSPRCMRMIYDPENERKALYAIKTWKVGKKLRADLYYRDYVERWVTKADDQNGHREEEWMPYTAEVSDESGLMVSDNGIVAHDYGEIPVVHFRTDMVYGVGEAIDGYNPQRAINKSLITLISTMEQLGYPTRYFLMDPQSTLDDNTEEDPEGWNETEVSKNSTPSPPKQMRNHPGVTQRVHGARGAGQFDAADPNSFLDPIMDFIKLMAIVTETPAYELNPSGDQPSGESRRQADKPLESKVKNRQAILKGSFKNLYRIALKAAGISDPVVDMQWEPTEPIDDAEGWATVSAKQEAGVPVAQTLLEAGYSQEQVDKWLDNIAEATTLNQKVETLGNIATALKDLGTAKTLEVISPEQINTIVESLIESMTSTEELA